MIEVETELISKRIVTSHEYFIWSTLSLETKKLIPEDWFIKKSVSTGQETFFHESWCLNELGRLLN